MTRRIPILCVLGVAVVAAGLWWRSADRAPAAGAWGVGERRVYTIDAGTRARVALAAGQALDGEIAVEGQLELRAYGHDGDRALVELELRPSRLVLAVGGVDALGGDPAGELGATRAWLAIAPDGSIASLQFAPEARPAWQDLASQLVGWLEVVTAGGTSWSAPQSGPFGEAEVSYARDGATLTRTRRRYTALDAVPGTVADLVQDVAGQGTIVLSGGHVARLDERERIAVRRAGGDEVVSGEAHLRLVLTETGRTRVTRPLALGASRRPGERIARHDERAALEARVGGLTPAQMMSELIGLGDVGLPDPNEWMWRVTALVRLHPELCGQLRELAASGRLGPAGVALVADVLVAAGGPEAEAALRAVVVEAPVSDDARVSLVQRLSLVRVPSGETIALARQLHDDARGRGDVDGARAAAYVAGNLAGTLRRQGDLAAAAELVAPLVDELARTTSPDDRVALAVAIGAAGLPEHAELLSGLSADADAGVRRAAIQGLARQDAPSARDALVALAGDDDGGVAGAALRALGDRDLDEAALDALVSRLAGGVAPRSQGDLVRLLAGQEERGVDISVFATAIEATLARGGDPRITAALRRML